MVVSVLFCASISIEVAGISSDGLHVPTHQAKMKVVKLAGGRGRGRGGAGVAGEDEEECGAVSQSVTGTGDYAELRAVIEHRRARPHLHLVPSAGFDWQLYMKCHIS